MHKIQEKILKLMDTKDVSNLTLREIADHIGETGSPQKIKHHLNQLAKRGMVKIDKRNNKIEKIRVGVDTSTNLVSLPILGNANCGEAVCFADNHVEGYLQISKNILGDLCEHVKNLFVLRAVGQSMNRSEVGGNTIEDGDYVIVNSKRKMPIDGDYVVSIIDGVANIKKIYVDHYRRQLVLVSESNQDIPPIYIHESDLDSYLIGGTVVKVMKKPDELSDFRNAALLDTLKALGPLSKEEVDYYSNV